MIKSTAQLSYELVVNCPHCLRQNDLSDQDFEGTYTLQAFSHEVYPLKGEVIECGYCNKQFEIDSMDIV